MDNLALPPVGLWPRKQGSPGLILPAPVPWRQGQGAPARNPADQGKAASDASLSAG